MKLLSSAATVVAAILVISVLPSAFANDMNATIIPEANRGEAHYIGVKNLTLRYPAGSSIANQIGTEDQRVTASVEGNMTSQDSGVISAITAFNRALIDIRSPTQVTAMEVRYTAVVKPGDGSALISFKVEAIPILEKFVLGASEDGASKIVDLEWRGIHVTEPVNISVPGHGTIDVNRPISLIKSLYPEVAQQIEGSPAAEMFDEPILDFRKFDQKMDTWHFLFDPSGSLVETSAFFRESSGARVVSIYSLGESSFREGTFEAEEKDAEATMGGSTVAMHSQVPAPSGQVQVAGFSKLDVTEPTAEFAIVSVEAPADAVTATGGFPIQVLLVFGGMMGAIAVFILLKARK